MGRTAVTTPAFYPASSFVLRRAGEVHKNPPERGSESLSRAGTLPHPEGGRTAAHRGEHGASATCAASFLNSWRKGNEDNYANFYSSDYDMLLRVAAVSVSQEARDAYLEDAERLLLEQGNVIPLYYSTISWSLSEHYTGVFGDGLGRYFFYAVHKASK